MSYKNLLFDLDHTLLDFDAAEEVALSALLVEAGVGDVEAYKAYYRPMNKQLWKVLEQGLLTKKDLVNSRFARLFAHFGQQVDGVFLAKRYEYHLSQQGQTYEGARDLLETLSAAGYQLYAATNGVTPIQEGRLAASGLADCFRQVFISEQLGKPKPSPEFFAQVAARIPDFEPATALMIGDSLTADVAGGQQAGLDTIWFNPTHLPNDTGLRPTKTIHSYGELLDFLGLEVIEK